MSKSPDAFRTISEVAEWLDTPTYVLRFWESRFLQIKPVKRAGGRRYYRPDDMLLLGGIKQMLHFDEQSIKDVQETLKEQGVKYVMGLSPDLNTQVVSPPSKSDAKDKADIDEIVKSTPKAQKKPAVDVRVVKKAKLEQDNASNAVADAVAPKEAEVSKEDTVIQEALAQAKAEDAAAQQKAADEEANEWGSLVPDRISNLPYRIGPARAYSKDAMSEIETLYYSLRMARNSMRRAKKQKEKRAS